MKEDIRDHINKGGGRGGGENVRQWWRKRMHLTLKECSEPCGKVIEETIELNTVGNLLRNQRKVNRNRQRGICGVIQNVIEIFDCLCVIVCSHPYEQPICMIVCKRKRERQTHVQTGRRSKTVNTNLFSVRCFSFSVSSVGFVYLVNSWREKMLV